MKILYTSILFLVMSQGFCQTVVSGKVTDTKGMPIEGANVYIGGSYDGGTTDAKGDFSFKTDTTGIAALVVSFLSYETLQLSLEVRQMTELRIKLKPDVHMLDAVVLSAGTFEAGDNSKVSVLKPLDVVTTASALGDFVGALQTLPGTSTVAEDGRLFVRGGDAAETQIFIDGLRVFTPYTPSANNTPTRGRYSPFLFDGITFSTGGYSAEFGQALSSVLLLNTIDEPDQNKTDIGIMTLGGSIGHTKKWSKSSLSGNVSYINLAPYNSLFPGRNDWMRPFQSVSGEAVFRQQFNQGLLKLYTAYEHSNFELTQEDINLIDGVHVRLADDNLCFNGSYTGKLSDNWKIGGGLSYTDATTKTDVNDRQIRPHERSYHAKVKLDRRVDNHFKIHFGAEYFSTDYKEIYSDTRYATDYYGFQNSAIAGFAEASLAFSKKLALKGGLRADYSGRLNSVDVAPRVSMAYKTSPHGQVSLAYGTFYQDAENSYLKFNEELDLQKATHYIVNYQYNMSGRIFRAEAYRKKYRNLITYTSEIPEYDSDFSNSGFGYAQGVDVFWRDSKSLKNIDYWVSYSFLDTQRRYQNFPQEAQPSFVNRHNFSVVGKYWINDLRSQVGFSYAFASGRNYTDPNQEGFLNARTKSYHNLSLNWAYLLSAQKILYFSVGNALGFKNINGYQYINTADANGRFQRRALRPATDQFFFVGFFWTISEKGTDNQLDNL